MTCVLARPPFYTHTSPNVGEGRVPSLPWEDYDSNWIRSTPPPFLGTELRNCLNCTSQRNLNKVDNSSTCDIHGTKSTEVHSQNEQVAGVKEPSKGVKRKASECDFDEIFIPPKRISPFLNTPKERKEERRKVIKISLQKIKAIEDAELSLRRSVLINNTMKRLKTELRKDTKLTKKKRRLGHGLLNNDCLSDSYLVDDPFLSGVHEKITDDMTDILMNNLENKIGARIACLSSVNDTNSDNVSAQHSCKTDGTDTREHESMDLTMSGNAIAVSVIQQSNVQSSDSRIVQTSGDAMTVPRNQPTGTSDGDLKTTSEGRMTTCNSTTVSFIQPPNIDSCDLNTVPVSSVTSSNETTNSINQPADKDFGDFRTGLESLEPRSHTTSKQCLIGFDKTS